MSTEPIDLGDEPDYTLDPIPPRAADQADWFLRRLRNTQRRCTELHAIADAEHDTIDTWLGGQLEPLGRQIMWLTDSLAQFHRAVLDRDSAAKTIDLPHGVLKARVQAPEWTFDAEPFLAWAQANAPELVRTPDPVPAVDKTAAKKALVLATNDDGATVLSADGEVVPGVTVTLRDVKYTSEATP